MTILSGRKDKTYLNPEQKKALITGICLFIVSLLFPPWGCTSSEATVYLFLGLHPVFPPGAGIEGAQVDYGLLIAEWIVLFTVTGMFLLVLSTRCSQILNSRQRIVLMGGIWIFAASCILLPWSQFPADGGGQYAFIEFSPIFNPSHLAGVAPNSVGIDWHILLLEWCLLTAITGGIVLAVRDK